MPSTMKNIIQCAVNNALNRNVKWMDTTILIYALSRSDSEARRILSDGGIDYEDAYQYLKRFDNEPLKEGEKPRFTPTALRLVGYVNSPLALLRAIQRTDCDGRGLPASAGRNDVFGDVGERRSHPKTGLYNIVKPPACFVCVYASVCIRGCIQMHTARPECIHGPDRTHGDAYPGAWDTRSTRPGTAPTGPSTTRPHCPAGSRSPTCSPPRAPRRTRRDGPPRSSTTKANRS